MRFSLLTFAIGSSFFSGLSCFGDIKKETLELYSGLEAGTVEDRVDVTWLYMNRYGRI